MGETKNNFSLQPPTQSSSFQKGRITFPTTKDTFENELGTGGRRSEFPLLVIAIELRIILNLYTSTTITTTTMGNRRGRGVPAEIPQLKHEN